MIDFSRYEVGGSDWSSIQSLSRHTLLDCLSLSFVDGNRFI